MDELRAIAVTDDGEAITAFWQGVKAAGPILVGVVPFGITCGVMGLTAGLTSVETVTMSLMVFAGASQFVGITMLGAGITGWGIIVLTTLLINLRHMLMGASLAPYMVRLSLPLQVLLSFLLTDEAYAVTISRIEKSGYSVSYQFGASISLYVAWFLSTAVGVFLGSYIPDPLAWGLDFAMPVTFLVLLLPRLTDKISLIVCVIAGIIAVAGAAYLPGKWYMMVACIVATVVGGLLEGGKNSAR